MKQALQVFYDELKIVEEELVNGLAAGYNTTPLQNNLARCKAKINLEWSKESTIKYQTYRKECHEYGEATGRCLA